MCCRYYIESSERTQELVEQMPPSLRSRWERTDAVRTIGDIKPTAVCYKRGGGGEYSEGKA